MADVPVTLPVRCAPCGGAVTIQTTGRRLANAGIEQIWTCPYCAKKNTGTFPYWLSWVTKRHGSAPVV